MVSKGYRAVLFRMVQRTDCAALTLVADIDAHYASTLAHVLEVGIQVFAYVCTIDHAGGYCEDPCLLYGGIALFKNQSKKGSFLVRFVLCGAPSS